LELAQELGLNNDGLDKFLAFLSVPEIDLINLKDNRITTDRVVDIFAETMKFREEEEARRIAGGEDNRRGVVHL
jgi:hypothetical protein